MGGDWKDKLKSIMSDDFSITDEKLTPGRIIEIELNRQDGLILVDQYESRIKYIFVLEIEVIYLCVYLCRLNICVCIINYDSQMKTPIKTRIENVFSERSEKIFYRIAAIYCIGIVLFQVFRFMAQNL